MTSQAAAFWVRRPGVGEIRPVTLPVPGPDEVLVRATHSGVSRGTEALVFTGRVPPGQYERMRAPFQEGDFPGPVKYGYLSVGVVELGPEYLRGRPVFCLYPHQSAYVVPAGAVTVVPDGVPPARAVLAGTVETAVNACWDAGPLIGDRITVVGGGMVGCSLAAVLAGLPGARVTLVDVDESRAAVAGVLGVAFATPGQAPDGQDLVFHTSASGEGLALALRVLRPEGEVIELSWYGDRPVPVPLGEAFHSGRLAVRASQVGAVAPARRGARRPADRLALALDLLRDARFDALLSGESTFAELPVLLPALAARERPAICHVITYD